MTNSGRAALWSAGALALLGGAIAVQRASTPRAQLRRILKRHLVRISKYLEVRTPPLILTDNVENAASTGRHILVNPAWIHGVLERHCSNGRCSSGVIVGVLAHEMGHHVNGHALQSDRSVRRNHESELLADVVAGLIMREDGLDHGDFARVLDELSPRASATHPASWRRIDAIKYGFHLV